MRKILILILASLISIGCGDAAQRTPTVTTINSNQTTSNAPVVQSSNVSTVQPAGNQAIVSSHSNTIEKPAAPPSENPASTESPMARPVDVNSLTADIEKAEKEYKKNPAAKDQLAKAYFVRATILTGAAQYRQALGDYRKGLKLNPNDEAAKSMHDEILRIFKSINREPPKEGEEPKPLAVQ